MGKRGFSLAELVVAVGIALLIGALTCIPQTLAQRQDAAEAQTLRILLDETRQLARANDGTGSGAMLVLRNAEVRTDAAIVLNRPMPGFDPPQPATRAVPVQVPSHITIDGISSRDFSIAFAPNGRIDVLPFAATANSAPVLSAPGCGPDADTLTVIVGSGPRHAAVKLRCSDGSTLPTSASSAG